MSFEDLAERLSHHESASQKRFETLHHAIKEKGYAMSDSPHVRNVFEPVINPMGMGGYGGYGAGAAGLGGAGGAALGALFGSALGGNGGLFGNRNGGEFVTPMQLQTATGSIIDSNQNTVLLQAVGDTKLAVATTGAAVQIAADANTQAIRTHLGQVENTIGMMASNNLQAINGANVNILTSAAATREAVAQYGQANLTATKDSQFATQVAISNSTKEIIAALNDQNTANLQRQLTVAENALAEQRADGRARVSELNITNTNTATSQQLQTQNQMQNQWQLLAQIAAGFNNLTNDVQAIRQGSVVFNSGTMAASGNQSANNTRVA